MNVFRLINPLYVYKKSQIIPRAKSLVKRSVQSINIFSAKQGFPLTENDRRLLGLKDKHKGQRCFVIGTGPSLNRTDLSFLKDEILFGVNTLYSGLSKFNIKCNYWAVTDIAVWEEHFKDILGLDNILLLSGSAAKDYLTKKHYFQQFQKNEPITIRHLGLMWIDNCFCKDLIYGAYNGDTVIIDICIQAAYYMGFEKVYLLGCDSDYSGWHRFDRPKSENKTTPAIEGDFSRIFKSYEICKKAFEDNDREIINATVGGKLEIFKRKRLERIFCNGKRKRLD